MSALPFPPSVVFLMLDRSHEEERVRFLMTCKTLCRELVGRKEKARAAFARLQEEVRLLSNADAAPPAVSSVAARIGLSVTRGGVMRIDYIVEYLAPEHRIRIRSQARFTGGNGRTVAEDLVRTKHFAPWRRMLRTEEGREQYVGDDTHDCLLRILIGQE